MILISMIRPGTALADAKRAFEVNLCTLMSIRATFHGHGETDRNSRAQCDNEMEFQIAANHTNQN